MISMYVAVYVWGGIADSISVSEDLESLKKEMIDNAGGESSSFDPSEDDLKIFDVKNPVAPIFSYESYMEEKEEKSW